MELISSLFKLILAGFVITAILVIFSFGLILYDTSDRCNSFYLGTIGNKETAVELREAFGCERGGF